MSSRAPGSSCSSRYRVQSRSTRNARHWASRARDMRPTIPQLVRAAQAACRATAGGSGAPRFPPGAGEGKFAPVTQLRAEVDARERPGELPATAMVGGIPLVVRPLRQLARQGWSQARVVTADEGAARRVRDALARFPVPPSLAVDVVV